MDTTPSASTRPPGRRRTAAIALAAAIVGLVGGRLSLADPAGALVDEWHAPTYAVDEENVLAIGPMPVRYGTDDEGFVHLRGALGLSDVTVERANTSSGPWLAHVFTLPCSAQPLGRVIVEIGAADATASTPYEGFLQVNEDGQVLVGGWDLSVTPGEGGSGTASFVAMLDTITFPAAADPGCVDPEPGSTTTEAETTTTVEETTTTTEP